MLTHERLKDLLRYDSESGVFTWLQSKGTKVAGQPAGHVCRDTGMYVTIDRRSYRAHRLAWFYMNARWPDLQVDHIDRNPNNNAWINLREATPGQNSRNTRISIANSSGVKGVRWNRQTEKWIAQIHCDGVMHVVGYFDDLVEAKQAIRSARERLHGEFACHG